MKTCEGAVIKGSFSLPCLALWTLPLTYHCHHGDHNHPNNNCNNSDYNCRNKMGGKMVKRKEEFPSNPVWVFPTECCGMMLFQWRLWCSENMVGVVNNLTSFRVICGRSNCLPQNQCRNKKDIAVFFMEKKIHRLNA